MFSGPIHGVVSFITVVIVIIIAEQGVLWIYRSLADSDIKDLSQTEALIKILNKEADGSLDAEDIDGLKDPQ